MNKKDSYITGIVCIVGSIVSFMLSGELYNIVLLFVGVYIVYSIYFSRKRIKTFNDPEHFDERDLMNYFRANDYTITIVFIVNIVFLIAVQTQAIPIEFVLLCNVILLLYLTKIIAYIIDRYDRK